MKQKLIYEILVENEEQKTQMIAEVESVLGMQPTRIEDIDE